MADDADDYTVGYGRPPKHSQFKPGQSGNRRGRPRGSRGLKAELNAELDERVSVTIQGKARRIPKRRLVIKALTGKAVQGDVRAADRLLSLVIQAEGFEDTAPARQTLSETDRLILTRLLGDAEDAPTSSGDNPPTHDADPLRDLA